MLAAGDDVLVAKVVGELAVDRPATYFCLLASGERLGILLLEFGRRQAELVEDVEDILLLAEVARRRPLRLELRHGGERETKKETGLEMRLSEATDEVCARGGLSGARPDSIRGSWSGPTRV